ncbi:unnamed protein product [Callosobruchus maculatus]|uniref:Uncharacterized protein n=1 Tax=Callosobruchus maculatus TaxID=64391 RepID=A0A653CX87_CALMS|nr:unnamed protein product [Callosobruchus maculatus]
MQGCGGIEVPAQLPADNYRGYTYHTSFDDGASSTVVFFRGPLPAAPQVNFIQNSTFQRQTLASENVDPMAHYNYIEHNIPAALNGQNRHLQNTAFFRSPLSLIANILEHPVQQNSILHFFDQIPASTVRLQQPSMQTSGSIISQYLPANSPGYSEENEQSQEHRQDKSLDDTVVIGARLSEMMSEAPQTSTTLAPQTTANPEGFTMSQNSVDSIIKKNTEGTNTSSTSSTTETKTTTEKLSETTMPLSNEESSTIALLKDTDTSSSQTMKPESSTSIPNVLITKNSTTTNETSKDTESTTVEESDSENTTKMIIVVA